MYDNVPATIPGHIAMGLLLWLLIWKPLVFILSRLIILTRTDQLPFIITVILWLLPCVFIVPVVFIPMSKIVVSVTMAVDSVTMFFLGLVGLA